MYFLVLEQLLAQALLDLIYFPIWWYSAGAYNTARTCAGYFRRGNSRLAPGLWLKNMFVPMYGQFDWQGRLISIIMRFVQFVFRSIALIVWLLVCVALFLLWLAFPVFVIWQLYGAMIIKH